MLREDTLGEYHAMLDQEDGAADGDGPPPAADPSRTRQLKIQGHRRRESAARRRSALRARLSGGADEDDGEAEEGRDRESLGRELCAETLRLHAEESLGEVRSCRAELEMLGVALRIEGADARKAGGAAGGAPITQHPITGELEYAAQRASGGRLRPAGTIRREDLGGEVFRPSWNQPTMTLDELALRERDDSNLERSGVHVSLGEIAPREGKRTGSVRSNNCRARQKSSINGAQPSRE